MKKMLLSFLFLNFMSLSQAYAHDLKIKYSKDMKDSEKAIMENALNEVSALLPKKMIAGLPADLEIKISALSNHKSIPDEVCKKGPVDKDAPKEKAFIYGLYNKYQNVLVINTPVLQELQKGKEKSVRITCQHKSLYEQAIATIVHELTHAYDFNNGRISNSMDYIRRAGFKKGLLKIKNKNIEAMRSADPYELVNIAESFAVNMEYFTMDPEFACRKPSMFDFFKKLFGEDPFPTRNCDVNKTAMLSAAMGYEAIKIDPSRVYRIDYLLASAGKEISSGFGHSMFRIVMCAPEHTDNITKRVIPATPFGKKCLEDKMYHLVVSYRANVADATLNYVKGLTGGYPSMLYILSFNDVLNEYNRDELRDLISYPLNLTVKEREEFILKVIEEHWNYRGSYKFINNNCAVESYDLLKAAISNPSLATKSSVSPYGVLEDLDQLQFLSVKNTEIETYKAKLDNVLLAYRLAYGYKPQNAKADKAAVQKFIAESTPESRFKRFQKFTETKIQEADLNTELSLIKERLVTASSFSVMEAQIASTLALKYKKQAAELLTKTDNPKVKELTAETTRIMNESLVTLDNTGYGIPLQDEMVGGDELEKRQKSSEELFIRANVLFKEALPKSFETLEAIQKNMEAFNKFSPSIRKEYRAKLEIYITQVLKNLSRDDVTRELMQNAVEGDTKALKRIRELLGADMVTEKEILDGKLKKIIQESL